jgi:hypothetical protein
MSSISAGSDLHRGHDHASHGASAHGGGHGVDPALLTHDNTHMPSGWGVGLYGVLGLAGLACIGLTLSQVLMQSGDEAGLKAAKHAIASYHVGFAAALGIMLGCLAFVLIMHLVKAGWSVTVRRQAENVASLIPLGALLALPVVIFAPKLFKWMNPAMMEPTSPKFDVLMVAKAAFLNVEFFYARLAVYFVVWTYLALRLAGYSKQQDRTGDKWLSNKAGWTSAWGILVFALATAFAGIDLLKTLDFHWFSTMWGVYFFAGSMVAGVATLIVLMSLITASGKLKGLYTKEHSHDMGKLLFAFMVFWAYIAFSQYFLYWYANIPEETAWVLQRGGGDLKNAWTPVFWILCIGHFIAPFPLLLIRKVKQTPVILSVFALWLLALHCVDMFWIVRPMVYPDTYAPSDGAFTVAITSTKIGLNWVDFTGALGPVLLVLAAALWKLSKGPLIPLKDPRLVEAASHKNYV